MKKAIALVVILSIGATSECVKDKRVNKASEFLKGAVALTAATALAYLAYEAPVGKIQEKFDQLRASVIKQDTINHIDSWLKNRTETFFNSIKTSTPWDKVNKTKVFSLLAIIPSWELFKYGLEKLGNSVRSHKKSCKNG